MRGMIAGAVALLCAGPVAAETVELSDYQANVVGCLEALGEGTTWGQCLGVLFEDCASEEVGSEGHVACLNDLHAGWSGAMDSTRIRLTPKLSPEGADQLNELVEQ